MQFIVDPAERGSSAGGASTLGGGSGGMPPGKFWNLASLKRTFGAISVRINKLKWAETYGENAHARNSKHQMLNRWLPRKACKAVFLFSIQAKDDMDISLSDSSSSDEDTFLYRPCVRRGILDLELFFIDIWYFNRVLSIYLENTACLHVKHTYFSASL